MSQRRWGQVYRGTVLTIEELLSRAAASSDNSAGDAPAGGPPRHTVLDGAELCVEILRAGGSEGEAWRFGVVQTLDDYLASVRRGGIALGARVFEEQPPPTGSESIDAGFAALADYLADRDGWKAPAWTARATRPSKDWFPGIPAFDQDVARRESPSAFARRGIFVTVRSLSRV